MSDDGDSGGRPPPYIMEGDKVYFLKGPEMGRRLGELDGSEMHDITQRSFQEVHIRSAYAGMHWRKVIQGIGAPKLFISTVFYRNLEPKWMGYYIPESLVTSEHYELSDYNFTKDYDDLMALVLYEQLHQLTISYDAKASEKEALLSWIALVLEDEIRLPGQGKKRLSTEIGDFQEQVHERDGDARVTFTITWKVLQSESALQTRDPNNPLPIKRLRQSRKSE